MTLAPGARLGAYEVTAQLGAGGMGKVYRARDTRLQRDVALKVLPDAFASDPDRLARFEREARVLASLNHPNIAHVYGLERSEDTTALVMELVEGPTLADLIECRTGPGGRAGIPLDEALPIARQIAEALEAAHEQGIIHRDLKPANVKVRPDGTVKVLDFGLAKPTSPAEAGHSVPHAAGVGDRGVRLQPDPTAAPTISSPALLTGAGIILGTAAYMAPEQAKGRAVDKRSDIWAFGCVIYEMLTGRRAFDGEDVSDTIASVLRAEPDWSALPAEVPAWLRLLMKECLAKDPRRRVRDLSAAIFVLGHGADLVPHPEDSSRLARARRPLWSRVLPYAAAVVVTAVLAGAIGWFVTPASERPVGRFSIPLAPDAQLATSGVTRRARHLVAISPDGLRLTYTSDDGIHLRRFEELVAVPVRGTESGPEGLGSANPFFSPDGQWIGFWADGQLKKVPVGGGTAVALCAAQMPFGATWGADDTIVYGQGAQGIWRVPAAGGSPEQLVKVNAGETAHGPQILPGGRVLFTVATSADWNDAQIVVQAPDTGDRQVLLKGGTDARYLSTGHLVYAVRNNLLAVPFDVKAMSIAGAPVSLLDDVAQSSMGPAATQTGAAHFSISASGTLVYVPASALEDVTTDPPRTLVWVDREGREEPLGVPPRAYLYPRLSPDGSRVVVEARDRQYDIWVWDLARKTLTRVTSDPGFDTYPLWTLDGRRLLFTSTRGARPGIFLQPADGTGTAVRLTEHVRTHAAVGMSPDGARVVVVHQGLAANGAVDYDLLVLSMRPSLAGFSTQTADPQNALSEAQPLIRTQFDELNGVISPDGRWLAYQANASGQWEIYVRPFPNVDDGLWQVSTAGGQEPLFSSTGRELFFRGLDRTLMAVTVAAGTTWSAGAPKQLVAGRYFSATSNRVGRSYDATRDGRRFVMINEEETAAGAQTPDSLIVVQNWVEELKRLVP